MPFCPRCDAEMDAEERACPQCGGSLDDQPAYRAEYHCQELFDLGLSPELVAFVLLEPKPKPFASQCEPRDAGWACHIPDDVSAAYPLWSYNADVIAVWVRGGKREFVRLFHDDPEPAPLAMTEQGLLARLFVRLIEREDWKNRKACLRRLRQAAARVGFRALDSLVAWHDQYGAAADFQHRLDQFIRTLDDQGGA
jgi:hypothetical protein